MTSDRRMLSKHDALLLKDLKLQPRWLLWTYIALGIAAGGAGVAISSERLPALLCLGGGVLLALGAEKLVTRRLRSIAIRSIPIRGISLDASSAAASSEDVSSPT
jgi:hypothetical protein